MRKWISKSKEHDSDIIHKSALPQFRIGASALFISVVNANRPEAAGLTRPREGPSAATGSPGSGVSRSWHFTSMTRTWRGGDDHYHHHHHQTVGGPRTTYFIVKNRGCWDVNNLQTESPGRRYEINMFSARIIYSFDWDPLIYESVVRAFRGRKSIGTRLIEDRGSRRWLTPRAILAGETIAICDDNGMSRSLSAPFKVLFFAWRKKVVESLRPTWGLVGREKKVIFAT